MSRAVRPERVRSSINVTPLVDVVLVLLIIFMIVAPRLHSDAAVRLPKTDGPPDRSDDGRRIVVVVDHAGSVWIDDDPVEPDTLPERVRAAAGERRDVKVVIKGDARLPFGAIRETMLAVESAGFENVGLIAERLGDS